MVWGSDRPQPASPNLDRGQSDRFWSLLYLRGSEAEHYEALSDITQASDRVVVAKIESIELGRQVGESYPISYTVLNLRVLRTLRGPTAELVKLEIILPSVDKLEELKSSQPEEESVFFLRDKGSEALRLGLSAEEVRVEQGSYRLVSSQGVLRNLNGQVGIPIASEDSFLLQLSGESFEHMEEKVREFADDG